MQIVSSGYIKTSDSNLTINTPLLEVVVDSSTKVLRVAHPLFENCYPEIVARNEEGLSYKKKCEWVFAAVNITAAAAAATGAILTGYVSDVISFGTLGGAFGGFFLCNGLLVAVSHEFLTHLDRNISLIKIADSITEFYHAFESFMNMPQKCDVRNLFDKYECIINQIEDENIVTFNVCAKYKLMEAVLEFLNNSDLNFDNAWQMLGIEKPIQELYIDTETVSTELAKKVVQNYKKMLEDVRFY